MGWDRHEMLWNGVGQKNMSHGQACKAILICQFSRTKTKVLRACAKSQLLHFHIVHNKFLPIRFPTTKVQQSLRIRFFCDSSRSNCTDEYKKFENLKTLDTCKLEVRCFVHKFFNNMLPQCFTKSFKLNSALHPRKPESFNDIL